MEQIEIGTGYTPEIATRIHALFSDLLPSLHPYQFAITGGSATLWNLSILDMHNLEGSINDLDIIIQDQDSVIPPLSDNFLITHYHNASSDPAIIDPNHIYIAAYHIESRIKIDIFSDNLKERDLTHTSIDEQDVLISSAIDRFVALVLDVQRIGTIPFIQEKYFHHLAEFMATGRIDMEKAEELWKRRNTYTQFNSLMEALTYAQATAQAHPKLLENHPLKPIPTTRCEHCIDVEGFPLTTKEALLSYIHPI